MTSQSPRIYLYKITFEEVPYYYYGVHKEKVFGEEYWGSPKTHKWCWELYTPKKQILEIFPFTDEGWIEVQEVEKRLIKPFYNEDKWCLNESCGLKVSLKINRETGKKSGLQNKQNKVGIHGRTKDEIIRDSKIGGNNCYKNRSGIHSLTKEERSEINKINGKGGGESAKIKKVGIFSLTKEKLSESGKIGGKMSCSQKWKCLETGFVSNAGNLAKYQRARGIDTSKRIRVFGDI